MKQMRFGVLGVSGHFIQRVLPPCRESETVAVHGLASRDRQRAEAAAARFGIPAVFDNYRALIESPDIDAVFIPLPNHLHLEWIKRAIEAGKPVLCEKPLGLNAREAAAAAALAVEKNVPLMEAFMYKFHPQWRHVFNLAQSGEIGEIRSLHTDFFYHNSDPANIRNIQAAGGGGLLDIGCYAVSAPRFILGREPERVSARIVYDPVTGTDTLATGILDFGEVAATFAVGTRTFPCQRVVLQGTDGFMEILVPFNVYPDVPAEVVIATGLGRRVYRTEAVDQYRLMFEAFTAAVWGRTPLPVSPEDAVANMKVLDALVRAHEKGAWEKV